MREWCLYIVLMMCSLASVSQAGIDLTPTSQREDAYVEMDFIRYLMGRGDLSEAFFLLDGLSPVSLSQADSIAYLQGWAMYLQKNLKTSADFLLTVSDESPLYAKSRFFATYNLAHEGHLSLALASLPEASKLREPMPVAMKNFQVAGLALLSRDLDLYASSERNFSGNFQAFAQEEKNLETYAKAIRIMPKKSPLIAGVLSTAVPGLGKIYAGKTGEGVSGFMYTMAFGATAYDFYRHSGAKSPLFIITASIAGIFYVGNIWGSVFAVNRVKREKYYEIDQRILFDMHIPLRNAFN
jgi:TM2 domain-containing membrane protein YozV